MDYYSCFILLVVGLFVIYLGKRAGSVEYTCVGMLMLLVAVAGIVDELGFVQLALAIVGIGLVVVVAWMVYIFAGGEMENS